MTNYVYIAASLDGYIATADGGVEWLEGIPNPDQADYGFAEFMSQRRIGVQHGEMTPIAFGVQYRQPGFTLRVKTLWGDGWQLAGGGLVTVFLIDA